MRKIDKKAPPADLARFVEKEHPQKFDDIHHSKQFPGLYEECREQLLDEQEHLSGYTEKPLAAKGIHVDHYRRQALFNSGQYIFGWSNLIADEHADYGADCKDSIVKNCADYDKLINPVEEDPHRYLTYVDEGLVVPQNDLTYAEREKAEYTIETFNLKHKLLVEKRRAAIKMVREYKGYGLSDEVILDCMKGYGFPSVVEYALMK